MLKDFYTKLSEQERKIFYVALGFILLAAFDFLFLQKVTSKLKSLDRDIEQTKNDINRNVRFLAYQEKIFKENEIYSVYQADERKTEEESIAAFLKTIENLGTEAEVTLGKLNPADAVSKKGYMQYYANVECNGKFENIIKFIHKIDTTNNLLKVVKMNITGKKSSADEVTVSMKISKLIIDAQLSEGAVTLAADVSGKTSVAGSSRAMPAAGALGSTTGSNKNNLKTEQGLNGQAGQGSRGSASGQASLGDSSGDGQGSESKGGLNKGGNSGSGQGGAGDSASGGNGGGGSGAGSNGGSGQGGAGDSASGGNGSGGSGAGSNGGSGQGGAGDSASGENGGGGNGEESDDNYNANGSAGQGGGESGAGGFSGSGGDSAKGQGGKKALETDSSNTVSSKNKKATPLNEVKSGQRLKVKNIESLWNDFWGIKPKNNTIQKKIESREMDSQEYQNSDVSDSNVWQRMMKKK
ncbi:MAG: type 4a pilus biogenesis protein PilO [Candidatus Omnitrophica bacterium]|nr:type 4a pilus biogenesis protein PilO [Candidatus Omnitrophota bacterium]